MTDTACSRVRFGDFELDLRSGELRGGNGHRVLLPQQPFRTLAALVRAQGNIVTREELRHELWPDDTFVDFDHGINAVVKRLREAIADSATVPRFIETIPRIGYRFIAPVRFEGVDAVPVDAPRAASIAKRRAMAVAAILLSAATLAVVARWISAARSGPAIQSARTLQRLTSSSGLSIDPALSSDGTLLAYAADREGTSGLDIWIQPVAGGTARRLTSDADDEIEPSFSPDGASIFYSRRETGGVYRLDLLGGVPRQVIAATRARMPRVSPDGRWVVYWTGQSVWDGGSRTPSAATSALAVVSANGGTQRDLASNLVSARYGVWSPDGQQILFLGEDQEGIDWFVVPRDGGEPRRTGAIEVLRGARLSGTPIPGEWSTDGHVVFSLSGGEPSNVWQLPISSESARVSGGLTRLTFGSAEERSPVATRSGLIAFSSVVDNVDVWRIPLDTHRGVARGLPERVTTDTAIDQMMEVTGDGQSMVFISTRANGNEAWLRDFSTGREQRLTFNGAEFARIQPDGSHLAIRRPGSPNVSEIVTTDAGKATKFCDDCQIDDWSPDGSKLVVERGNPRALFVHDVATGIERPLATHPTWSLLRGRFSPDGKWVVFHTTNSVTLRQIYAVPVGEPVAAPVDRWVPIVTDFGIQPAWSPDGRGLYHFSLRDGFFCAWMQPIDPASARPIGEPRAVQHLHEPRLRAVARAIVNNDVSDNYLYVTLTETTGNIWILR